MATWAPAHADAPVVARPHPRVRPAHRSAPQRRVTTSVVWIVVLAVLLAGIVALNVAVLRLNLGLDQLSRERAQLRADNAALGAQLSSAAAAPKIEALAKRLLGVQSALPQNTTYVELARQRP